MFNLHDDAVIDDATIERSDWYEFQSAGLFWYINRLIHLFGWCLIWEVDDAGTIVDVYPARTTNRGFDSNVESKGFQRLTRHINDNRKQLLKAVKK